MKRPLHKSRAKAWLDGCLTVVVFVILLGTFCASFKDTSSTKKECSPSHSVKAQEEYSFMGFRFGEMTNAELELSEINHCLWRRVKTPTRLLDLDSFDHARLCYTVQSKRLFKIVIKDEYEIDEYGLTDTEKRELESYAKTIEAIIKAKYNVSAKPADHYKIGDMKITFEHGVRIPTTYYALRLLGDNSARKQYYRVVELTVEDENMSNIAEAEWENEIADAARRKKDEEQKKREDRVNNAKRFL